MVTEYSYSIVKHKPVSRQVAEPFWDTVLAFLQKLQPHVLVVKICPQLEKLHCKRILLLDMIEGDVPRCIQRLVFV
jgi:hypothetical protein